MAERTSTGTQSTQEWALGEIFDNGAGLVIAGTSHRGDPAATGSAAGVAGPERTEADPGPEVEVEASSEPVSLDDPELAAAPRGSDVNAGAKRTLWWLASGVVLLAVLIVLAFLILGGG